MRILITGSRDWWDRDKIRQVLRDVDDKYAHLQPLVPLTLVSGACPRGADRMCEEIAQSLGWKIERHPADWKRFRGGGGPRRNQKMVDLGFSLAFAFRMPDSHGTQDCIDRIRAAGRRADLTISDCFEKTRIRLPSSQA